MLQIGLLPYLEHSFYIASKPTKHNHPPQHPDVLVHNMGMFYTTTPGCCYAKHPGVVIYRSIDSPI